MARPLQRPLVRRLTGQPFPDQYSRDVIRSVCWLAGSPRLLDDQIKGSKLRTAIARSDTPALFDWLMEVCSYQGISDQAAESYMTKHGNVTWAAIQHSLAHEPRCSKLNSFWQFSRCGYDKGRQTCSAPALFEACPLPTHDLRNGRLNQTAYSLFLFIRDIAAGNLVDWIDAQIVSSEANEQNVAAPQQRLISRLRGIFGVSDKVLSMALATMLMAAPVRKRHWWAVGASMIVVDTLVHNFLERTGILARAGASHPYGDRCYAPNGCAALIQQLSRDIDARQFNASYPAIFPRFVQHAVWQYCGQNGLNVCNGNMIDDRKACENWRCVLAAGCDRQKLQKPLKTA
jgi:hypothetical protein